MTTNALFPMGNEFDDFLMGFQFKQDIQQFPVCDTGNILALLTNYGQSILCCGAG